MNCLMCRFSWMRPKSARLAVVTMAMRACCDSSASALDFDGLCSEVFLIVVIARLTLPADGLFVYACRPSLGPRAQSPVHVPEVLILVQGQSHVCQGAFPGLVVPELGVHEDAIMVEEHVLLHPQYSPRSAAPSYSI